MIHGIFKVMAPLGGCLYLAEFNMNKFFKVAVWFALGVAASTSAFASGYGPAPFYKPSIGAPASQRGQSAQTIMAEQRDAVEAQKAYGGITVNISESGTREIPVDAR